MEVREGFPEEVTCELRPEGGPPSHAEESEGEHQAEETASAKVLGLIVFNSITTNGNNHDDNVTGAGVERMRTEGVCRGHITPGLASLSEEAGFG